MRKLYEYIEKAVVDFANTHYVFTFIFLVTGLTLMFILLHLKEMNPEEVREMYLIKKVRDYVDRKKKK